MLLATPCSWIPRLATDSARHRFSCASAKSARPSSSNVQINDIRVTHETTNGRSSTRGIKRAVRRIRRANRGRPRSSAAYPATSAIRQFLEPSPCLIICFSSHFSLFRDAHTVDTIAGMSSFSTEMKSEFLPTARIPPCTHRVGTKSGIAIRIMNTKSGSRGVSMATPNSTLPTGVA